MHKPPASRRKVACVSTLRRAFACAVALACGAFHGAASAQVCGNGVRELGEECDDGNRASLDGCSANCRFEQSQRFTHLAFRATTSASVCPSNALGSHAFTATALTPMNTGIDNSIADGSTSLLLYFAHGLDVSTGTGTELQIGVFNGTPLGATAGYDGTSDTDWWYAIDETELGASQEPAYLLPGSIAAVSLTANPGSFVLRTVLIGAPAELSLSAARLVASVGTSSTPMTYTSGTDRGHLASENLDPALQSFATLDGSLIDTGLCGNVSAASLAHTPVPPSLVAGGTSACSQGYTTVTNSFLDVVVSGCKVGGGLITAINATQPDTTDANVPPAGSGGPYKLTTNASHVVDTCLDNTNAVVDLTTCLNAAAYSAYFSFTADRVITKSTSAQDVIFHDQFDVFP